MATAKRTQSKYRRKAIKFKGFDWTELMQLQRIATDWPEIPKDFVHDKKSNLFEEDAKISYVIKKYLFDIEGKEQKLAAKYVRRFLTVLVEQDKAWGLGNDKVYASIAGIDHDETMLGWVSRNLECMWT